jgi:lysophospholipase L1-like esterase
MKPAEHIEILSSSAKAGRAIGVTLGLLTASIVPAYGQVVASPAVVATDRPAEAWWAKQHEAVLKDVREHPDAQLLLIGDSITDNYHKSRKPDEDFRPTWDEFYAPRKALNLGFSGDTTANVIWRLEHGEVDGLHPKVAIVLIGTNNTGQAEQTAEQTETGIDALIANLEERLPETRILLLGILPSDRSDSKAQEDRKVNRYLARCYGENPRVTYLDIGSIFYKNGVLNTALFYDPRLPEHLKALHPDTKGQRMMAEAIEPTLAKLMGDAPREDLAAMTDINTALIPVPRLEQDSYDWYARHHAELEVEKHIKPQVVMIGDSITHFWGGLPTGIIVNGPTAWSHLFGAVPVINMGFGWDRTQNVLWRLRQGELDGLDPKWVVLNIGTNNLTGSKNARANTPEEVGESIGIICEEIRKHSPASRIVVMAIFPRNAQPDTNLRKLIAETNGLLKQRFAKDPSITYLDIGNEFLARDSTLPRAMMPDGTHPSDAGYHIWADALIQAGVGR